MRWTWRIGRISAIPLHLHASLLAVMPAVWLLATSDALRDTPVTLPVPLFSALMIAALFLAVVLHELGHALAARGRGHRVARIVLSLAGGVTHIERDAMRWQDRLWIAAAGPLVNFTCGTLAVAIGDRVGQVDWHTGLLVFGRFNLLLVLVNLLPVGPLDGRQVLTALQTGLRARRMGD